MALRKVAVAALALAAAALWAPPRGAEAINTRPSEELAGGGLVPAAFLEQLSVCSSEAVAAQGGATCCGGFQCPYAGGVCCGSDAAFCCPMGTVCLPSGGAVAPQCGTPSRPVSGPGAVPGLLGTPGGVPSEPSSAAQAAARAAAAAASSAAPSSTSVPGGSGPVEWQQVRDASDSGAPDEVNLEKLGPKVKRTKFPVKLFLDIANLVYPFYLAKSNVLDLELRQDVARTENMAVQSVDVASVAPLRLRTDGSPADEKGLKIPVPAAAGAAAKARFAEEGFVPVSGVRAEIILYCGNEGHARAVARHLFLTVDGQTPEPLALTSLSAEPLDARANAALPFSALPSSRVLVGDAEYNDRSGRQVADRAQKDLAAIKAKELLVLSSVQTLARQVESQRRRLVDASAAEKRAADAAEQARKKADADERARRAKEESKKAADREDVLRRAAAAASREAQEQSAKDATAKQRAAEKAQEEAAKAKQASIKADWDMRAKPLELEQGVRVCGDGNDRVPQYALAGDLCVLSGAVCADTDNHRPLASAPRDCRPSGRLVFNRHDSSRRTWRADAFVTGRVAWNGGETTFPNATLDGIFYAVQGSNLTAPLELGASWVPAGGEFAAPTAFVQDGFCALSGAAALKSGDGSKWADADNVIAVVPAECRPDSRLVFNVAHHKLTVRVDVLPNGKVVYVDGARTYKWVSLDGIGYYANSTNATNYAPLALRGGYKAFGMGYRTPSVSFKAQLCALSGVVTGSTAADIAVLPANCRPASGALSFWLNQGSRAFEIDILQDGTVRRILPAYDSWISLDGVVFAAGNPQAWEGQVKSKAFTELQAQRAATAEKAKADAAAEAGAKKDAALKAEAEQKAAAKKPTF